MVSFDGDSSMRELLIAQALLEHGLLDSMAAGFAKLRYQLEAYVGQGRLTYVVVAVVILFAFVLARRPR
jgi:hypothetical protein